MTLKTVNQNQEKTVVGNEDVSLNVLLNVPLNTKTLAERLGLSRKTIQRELDWLQKHGAIRRVGAKKNGYWEVVKGNSHSN